MSETGPTDRQREQFRTMFCPGEFWVLVGPRGSGKTSWASQIIDSAQKWYPDYEVATNILYKKKVKTLVGANTQYADDHTPENIAMGTETYEEYYPPRIHKVTSMSEVFHMLPEILEKRHNLLLVIDEALQSEGFASGQSVLSADVRAVRSFASIIRKANVCVILIAQSWKMVASSYRNADFITGFMRRKYDGQIVPGYGRREVIEIIGPRGYEIKDDRLIVDPRYTIVVRTKPEGMAKPSSLAVLGDVIFDTKAPAQFGMGNYKKNGKKFQLFAAISAMGVIEEELVAALRRHLDNPPTAGGKKGREDGEEEAGVEPEFTEDVKHRHTPEATTGCPGIEWMKEAVREETSDRKIERDSEFHFKKSTVRDMRDSMRDSGEL